MTSETPPPEEAPRGARDGQLRDPLAPRADESLDTLLRGRVQLLQSIKGYRTSVDAMLLAWFTWQQTPDLGHVVDFGAGSGLVSIALGRARPGLRLTLVERQESLAARARRNLRLNGVEASVILHDLAAGAPRKLRHVDAVMSNPPYYPTEGRNLPPNPERRDAHYESTAPVEQFCRAAAAILGPAGVLCMVYPANGAHRLVRAYAAAGLGRMQLMPIHHRDRTKPGIRVLLAGRRGTLDVIASPRFAIHPMDTLDHTYHAELEGFLRTLPRLSIAPHLATPQGDC